MKAPPSPWTMSPIAWPCGVNGLTITGTGRFARVGLRSTMTP
jgi:hypothetical protein